MNRSFSLASLVLFLAAYSLAAPVPKGDKELPAPTPEQVKESRDNLRIIAIAVHAHHDRNKRFAHDITDKDGKPLLSWRVRLLPYLGDPDSAELYTEFRLTESWDSEHNKALVAKIPKVYQPVRPVTKEKGMTFYRGFAGSDGFQAAGRTLNQGRVIDGLSDTVLAIEASDPVGWTVPGSDLEYAAEKPLPSFGGLFDGNFHVVFSDGSTYWSKKGSLNVDEFRKAITCCGQERLDRTVALGPQAIK